MGFALHFLVGMTVVKICILTDPVMCRTGEGIGPKYLTRCPTSELNFKKKEKKIVFSF